MTSSGGKESAGRPASKSNASEDAREHQAWDQATRWLARRDRSVKETEDYLRRIGCPTALVERVLARLRARGYVHDGRLAQSRVEYWLRRGYGRERVRAELEARGVAEEEIAAALEAAEAREPGIAGDLVRRRFPRFRSDERQRARAYRFLLSRGFPEALVVVIVGEPC
ncbi:MAG: hypothetical protein KatS3mg077_2278 [Candidatus Binatia bacterium]|nr:MAG: hypothetical protein KatS3mg077_2278 [Candidatus Binatia bacterium]